MRLAELVEASSAVAAVSGKLAKVERLAGLLSRAAPEEIEPIVAFLSGTPRQGRIGIGGAAIAEASDVAAAGDGSLEIVDVDQTFSRLAGMSGAGSSRQRAAALRDLFARATRPEQDFLRRLLFGELRQGALEGVLVDAVARAAGVAGARVRRAVMMAGTLGPVARAAIVEGDHALDRFVVQLMRPVAPMLAASAGSVDEAFDEAGEASFELKLDGARIQAHKSGDDVRLFSRTLKDVTAAAPEVVALVRALPARELVLDGEVIALKADSSPHPFQITMRRFGRRLDVDAMRAEFPLTPFFFDCLYVDGAALLDDPLEHRLGVLTAMAPQADVPRVLRPSREQARAFAAEALRAGHEGVMAKSLAAGYAAGRRGAAWLKVKQARSLDLVILAAEWGHGRRRGWLSNLHLGARDPVNGRFVMLGKTFKGLTDEMLTWQTERLLTMEIGRDAYTVFVRPELVVEIAFNEIQTSPVYPGGMALRFARVKRYRTDKTAAEADTIETVRGLA